MGESAQTAVLTTNENQFHKRPTKENIMNKLRCDAIWNELTPEQREKIEEWLLKENLGVKEVHERAQKELGLGCSLSTIWRFHGLLLKLRSVDELGESQGAAEDVAGAGAKLDDLRSSSMKLIVARLLDKAMTRGDLKEISALGRLMLMHEEREIQRDRVDLSRERFQFKMSKAALEALPLLDEMSKDDEERELARIEAIKQKIFGRELKRKK